MVDLEKYQCSECGWIGYKDEMMSDSCQSEDDEAWSNWICPSCGFWGCNLDDYILLENK